MRIFLLLMLLLVAANAYAHGGEDHSAPSASVGPVSAGGSQLRLVSYPGSLEVFLKYPPPVLNEPIVGRLFFAEYASNHPVDPSAIELSFPGALGAKVTKQPAKISDGVYEFTAVFVRDTGHTALLKYNYEGADQLATLSPFYAGTSAERQLMAASDATDTTDSDGFPQWILLPIAAGLAVLGFVLFRRRRKRLALITSKPGATTITETKTTTV